MFLRDGDEVYRTYFIDARGDEALGSTWSFLDITAYGRQEAWEDSPGTGRRPRPTPGAAGTTSTTTHSDVLAHVAGIPVEEALLAALALLAGVTVIAGYVRATAAASRRRSDGEVARTASLPARASTGPGHPRRLGDVGAAGDRSPCPGTRRSIGICASR